MSLPKIDPTSTRAWEELSAHFRSMETAHMNELFAQNPERAEKLSIQWEDFYVDFSKNILTEETISLLLDLAKEVKLEEAIASYFSGEKINETEDRAVLHTALRANKTDTILVDGKNVVPEVFQVKEQIKTFTNQILSGSKKGVTGKTFTDVVNIGIGGSDLGPAMVVSSLEFYKNHLTTHFINNIDGDHVTEVIKKLNPETTLFVVVSKTFSTQETLSNASTIKNWMLSQKTGSNEETISKHFVAVSTNIEKVKQFGIDESNIFPIWDWVGGRFSLWSAVGLSISLSIGFENFNKLLLGANKMDAHFKSEALEKNIPVILALIGVWYNNFFKTGTHAIIPYSQYLHKFSAYLQQSCMESNGKSVDRNGNIINYQSGSIIWGQPGSNSQHAFFQLLHQGTKLIPADFIGFVEPLHGNQEHHDILISNFIAQTEALLKGKPKDEVLKTLEKDKLSSEEINNVLAYKVFSGNKPTNSIFINKLTPESLGKLIALYEHKIFVQGIIWNIFSFDQFGVELGKQLAGNILEKMKNNSFANHDASTIKLLHYYKKLT
ncbi:MAG TPA: glucose-6-phosphate isomerase [Xanthomarina sp.]|nr:glucose-6-phosphate isomerase [Xanthomarina sp.]